ncbi:MAG: energy transducer TonB [Bryobacteraceae bacterium]
MFETMWTQEKTARGWAMPASLMLQMFVISAMLLAPLIFIEPLPPVELRDITATALPLLPPPDRGVARAAPRNGGSGLSVPGAPRPAFVAPNRVPATIPSFFDEGPPAPVPSGTGNRDLEPGGHGDGVGGLGMGRPGVAPSENVARPKEPPKPPAPVRLRVGGNVRPPVLIQEVRPVYPPLARAARVSGIVRLESIIARDGRVQAIRVASGHPLLTGAAVEAVRQWRYRPTHLNDEPVEVILQIEVSFNLE